MTHEHEKPDGYTVFWWPEFQALAKRLMISVDDPITRVMLDIPMEGLVKITTETHGQDNTKKR